MLSNLITFKLLGIAHIALAIKNNNKNMTHYKLKEKQPTVLITKDKNELKKYKNNLYYLNNGDNFEIRLFNPLQETIGVKIFFNGMSNNNILVLNPGEDIIIDRYLDDNKKMVFKTYNIDKNNQDALDAISNNGNIKFEFYKEQSNYYNLYPNGIFNHFSINNINYLPPITDKIEIKYYTTCDNTINTSYDTTFSTSNNVNYYSSEINTLDINDKLETGRISKGDESNQELISTSINFETSPFYTLDYKILPMSLNNKKDLRIYCSGCNYRIKNKKWKYCPKCSTKIE